MDVRSWTLGDDLRPEDNLLDGITFDEIILTVHCNCKNITQATVIREVNDLVSMRLDDMRELLRKTAIIGLRISLSSIILSQRLISQSSSNPS